MNYRFGILDRVWDMGRDFGNGKGYGMEYGIYVLDGTGIHMNLKMTLLMQTAIKCPSFAMLFANNYKTRRLFLIFLETSSMRAKKKKERKSK